MEPTAELGEQFPVVLAAARGGAEWAWARIYDSIAPAMLGYLRARGAPDADGVCGDVLCQVVRDIHRFEGDEQGFRSWVFVMGHHRMLDDIRRRRRRPESLAAPETLWGAADGSDVEAEVVARLAERDLRSLVDALTPAQRDVLLLRIFGGLSVEEVSKAVKRRPGAVKALQRRGVEALRRMLADDAYLSEPERR